MDQEEKQLTLIHGNPSKALGDVVRQLTVLGHRVKRVELDDWFRCSLPGECLLFLDRQLGRSPLLPQVHQHLLARRFPVLGIIETLAEVQWASLSGLFSDFVLWPCSERELQTRLACLEPKRQPFTDSDDEDEKLRDLLETRMVGRSAAFRQIQRIIRKIAQCEAHALIEGETGTGKEVAAHAVHYLSTRQGHPFIPVNCGALPDNLFENELFGHERGAYTDARQPQRGLVAHAEGGTLFLDEVDSLTPRAQVALLRFVQDLRYRPLGGSETRSANVRIIAASNRPLWKLVETGEYRQDLYFRLNILRLEIPPLRYRRSDIEPLAEHFLARLRARYDRPEKFLHRSARDWLLSQEWPGNVRELENVIHREFLMAEGAEIYMGPSSKGAADGTASKQDETLDLNLAKARVIERFEARHVGMLLRRAKGNVTEAARLGGKERRAFGKLMKKYGIDRRQYQG